MSDRFAVELDKQQHTFSAAHFITYGENVCERLHGHNYRVAVRVEGQLEPQAYVVDFIALRDKLTEIVGRLDHRVLLPLAHAQIHVSESETEVVAQFEARRWVFPKDDCALLPVANTTTELLAQWILEQLLESMHGLRKGHVQRVIVSVDENQGQWASCARDLTGESCDRPVN